MSERGFFDSLEEQLGTGLDRVTSRRSVRRRRIERGAAITLGVVAIIAVGRLVLREEPAAAGVEVEHRGGLLYVRLTDVEHRADVIEEAAASAGLAITVEAVPTGPSLVGRFIGYEQRGEDTGELRELDRDGPAFSGFTIPAGYDGHLELRVGRPAESGEPYLLLSNALAPGEPLACSEILGASPSAASSIVSERDLEARWTVSSERGTRVVATADLPDGGDLHVTRAQSIGPNTVAIFLSDGSAPPPAIELTADAIC